MFETIREPMGVPQSYWQNKTGLQGITAQRGGTRANSHLISHSWLLASSAWPTEDQTNHTSELRLTEVLPSKDSQSTEQVSISQVLE